MTMKLNWLGIWVATVVAFFIGFLWYGLIFSEQWMALTGVTADEEGGSIWMALGFVQTFITMVGVLLAPALHRFLHRFHLDISRHDEDDQDAR